MVQSLLRTIEIPQLLVDKVIDAPVMPSTSLSWRRGLFPWSRLFCGPLHVDTVADAPVMHVVQVPVVIFPVVPQRHVHGLACSEDHRDSAVAVLAAFTHHTSRGQRRERAGEEDHEMLYTAGCRCAALLPRRR